MHYSASSGIIPLLRFRFCSPLLADIFLYSYEAEFIQSLLSTGRKQLASRFNLDILDDDQIQWHPPLIGHYTNFWPLLIWTLLPNLTFYLIVQGFHRPYATGAACQQRTLTPPDTWSCPTLGLVCVLMSRPISPELVLSPDFWISNTPRYFSFASHTGTSMIFCP